ncbi:MAG: hypothetical protein NC433_05745 [Clostridiales bacterium]|nr:hypothetical protein [Clostridiales bacterium]
MRSRDLFSISVELGGVAMTLSGLGNQLNREETDVLTPEAMKTALNSISNHLERIAEDLESMDDRKA